MQQLHLITVGSLREPAFAMACGEYSKRLNAYCKLQLHEIPEYRLPKAPSAGEIQRCLDQEGTAILNKLPAKAFTAALCIEGKLLSSSGLAERLDALKNTYSQLAFIIGGSHGLSAGVKQRADLLLSMSPMTFPHQLARVMLLEQLYRGYSICAGSKYHK